MLRLLLLAAFVVECAGIAYLTLSPSDGGGGGVVSAVLDWLTETASLPLVLVEPGLNVLLFVPFGLLGALLWSRRPLVWTLAGGAVSAGIELVQFTVPGRVSSFLDLAMNTSGAALGALLCLAWAAWQREGAVDRRS